jgi:hypothetical protein
MQFPQYATLSLSESLQHVIDDVDVHAIVTDRTYDQNDELDEINLYATLDPILAGLLKQYKDADKQADYLDNSFSIDDPMAEIAHDRRDSAWSAVETRLIELREDEKFASMVGLRLMRLEEERAGLIPKREYDKKWEEAFLTRERKYKKQEDLEKKDKEADLLMFFLWMWLTKTWAEKTLSMQNNLQTYFRQAA